MSKYKVMIGLEMHCEISETNSKVFSSAKNTFCEIPNSNVRPVDMAFPGTLPVLNKEAVRKALKASIILNCTLPESIYFERKNYYYPDLPKGYQITQETKPAPVGSYGYLEILVDGELKKIRVNNIHLEEDAASSDHYDDFSLIDYNRAGVPLLELVTEPDLRSADEAVTFLENMRRIYQYTDISEGDSKKGQIRCDVNVSIMDESLDENDMSNWGTKIEVKNVNSFSGVKGAINYEIKRQIEAKENGTYDDMLQQTRRWDENTETTVFMRSKLDAVDYKYFVEPNIPKYKLNEEFIEKIRTEIPILPNERFNHYVNSYEFTVKDANAMVKEKGVSDYFEKCISLGIKPNIASNWVLSNILGYLNKNEITILEFFLKPEDLKIIIDNIENGNLSNKQAKEIYFKSLEEKKSPSNFISSDNMQLNDEEKINEIITKILDNSEKQIEEYKNGRTNIFDYFVGQVMKETRGKASPVLTKEILQNKLNNR